MGVAGVVSEWPNVEVNKKIEQAIEKVILESNGCPGCSKRQYIQNIKKRLKYELTESQKKYLGANGRNLDRVIISVTYKITKDNF